MAMGMQWRSWLSVSCSWFTTDIPNRCDRVYDGLVVFIGGGGGDRPNLLGASFLEMVCDIGGIDALNRQASYFSEHSFDTRDSIICHSK